MMAMCLFLGGLSVTKDAVTLPIFLDKGILVDGLPAGNQNPAAAICMENVIKNRNGSSTNFFAEMLQWFYHHLQEMLQVLMVLESMQLCNRNSILIPFILRTNVLL